MKKEGFNPRINKIKNVNKMTTNELDETNKILENELKRRKLNLNNLSKFKGRDNLSPTSKAKTSASNSICRDSSSTNNNKNNSKKIEIDNSLVSLRKETSPKNYSNNTSTSNYKLESKANIKLNSEKNLLERKVYFPEFEDFQADKEKIKASIKREFSENRSDINRSLNDNDLFNNYSYRERLNQSAVYLKTTKNTKNLIPFKFNKNSDIDENKQLKQCLDRLKICQRVHLPKEKNYFISEKNLKLLESAINEKECDINILRSLLNMAKDDIDLYKNRYESVNIYIDEILNEKNNLIEDLVKISDEKNKIKENYDEYVDKYNKMLTFLKKIQNIIVSINKMKLSYEQFIEKYSDKETKLNLDKKFLINCERIDHNEISPSYIKLPENAEFLKKFQDLVELAGNEELSVYLKFFEKNNIVKEPRMFFDEKKYSHNQIYFRDEDIDPERTKKNIFLNPIEKDLLRIEKINKELREKIYDYETFFRKISHIYETKNVDLADAAKDVIHMKKRIANLNDINEDLERENDYLRISFHLLYNEMYGEKGNNETEKLCVMSRELNEIKDEAIKLNSIIADWKANYNKCEDEKFDLLKKIDLLKSENNIKEDEINRLNEEIKQLLIDKNNLIVDVEEKNNLAKTITQELKRNEDIINNYNSFNKDYNDKENIIKELKNKIIEMEKSKPNKIYFDLKDVEEKSPKVSSENTDSKTINNLTDYLNENEFDDRNDFDRSYNTNMDKLIKDSYLGSINKIKNSPKNNESLNYPKKSNAPIDIKNNENIIKNLRSKIQRQEIDLKFLNEKLKKLQGENPNFSSESSINSRLGSKLNIKEVNPIFNFKVENITDLLFHLYNQAKLIENITE